MYNTFRRLAGGGIFYSERRRSPCRRLSSHRVDLVPHHVFGRVKWCAFGRDAFEPSPPSLFSPAAKVSSAHGEKRASAEKNPTRPPRLPWDAQKKVGPMRREKQTRARLVPTTKKTVPRIVPWPRQLDPAPVCRAHLTLRAKQAQPNERKLDLNVVIQDKNEDVPAQTVGSLSCATTAPVVVSPGCCLGGLVRYCCGQTLDCLREREHRVKINSVASFLDEVTEEESVVVVVTPSQLVVFTGE